MRPNSYLAINSLDDVARLESRTFICTSDNKSNNWHSASAIKSEIIPFVMGRFDETGLMITDSPYVAVSIGITACTGYINMGKKLVKCLHSVGKGGLKWNSSPNK